MLLLVLRTMHWRDGTWHRETDMDSEEGTVVQYIWKIDITELASWFMIREIPGNSKKKDFAS